MNDAVLAANDGAWDKPPPQAIWSPEHLERARVLLESNFSESLLGFKDPRTLLVVDGWKQVFPEIQFVGVVRHPDAVALSLHNRSGMPRRRALSLWYAYNRVLIEEYHKSPFPILCFDEDEDVFHEKLDRVIGTLGLDAGDAGTRFYDEQLRTSNETKRARWRILPRKVKRLYEQLCQLCL